MAGGPFDGALEMARQEVGMKMRTAARAAGPVIHKGFVVTMNNFYNDYSPNNRIVSTYNLHK